MDIGKIFNSIAEWFSTLGEKILSIFPDSPFQAITANDQVKEVLGWLNYFVPVGEMLAIMQAWLVAIGLYYLWMVIARWVKVLG